MCVMIAASSIVMQCVHFAWCITQHLQCKEAKMLILH